MTYPCDFEVRFKGVLVALILFVLFIILAALSGCATYDIERCEDGVCSSAHISSPRKFKSIAFKYNGEQRTFELQAGDVGTDVSALNTLASVILLQAQQDNQE